jgi:hypothetical protein
LVSRRKAFGLSTVVYSYLWLFECDSAVSETQKMKAIPNSPQRHIVAGLAAVVGGLVAPYERASHIHDRPILNWLWASGHHPFGPFSNTSTVSHLLRDTAKVSLL